jgi:hypothetical protein
MINFKNVLDFKEQKIFTNVTSMSSATSSRASSSNLLAILPSSAILPIIAEPLVYPLLPAIDQIFGVSENPHLEVA